MTELKPKIEVGGAEVMIESETVLGSTFVGGCSCKIQGKTVSAK